MISFKPAARGDYESVSKITDQFTKWIAVYLPRTKDQALALLEQFVTFDRNPELHGTYTGAYFALGLM